MILIVITGTCGAGKSTLAYELEKRLDARRFACIGADETGLNWHDYAGTDREQSYNGDCLNIAAARAEGRHLVFASCMTPQDYMTQSVAPDGIEATYFVALSAEDDIIERRLRERPSERGFTTDEAIRPHVEYNRWIRKNRNKYQLHIDTSRLSVQEAADIIAERISQWTEQSRIERRYAMPSFDGTTIRTMRIEDYDGVYDLWIHTPGMGLNDVDDSRDGIAAYLKRNPSTSFVAEENGRIVGAILAGHDGRRGFIHHTAVLPACRSRGVGKKLAESAMAALEKEGINKAMMVVFARNADGNGFWEHLGFTARNDLVYRNKNIRALRRIDT